MNLKEFINICHLLYQRKYVVGSGGNVSIRVDDTVYITPTGSILGCLREEDVSIVDMEGNIIKGEPSSELKMHLGIYRNRKDINSVIHTHSLYAIALSVLDKEIELITPESKVFIKKIGYVPYLEAGSEELAKEVFKRKEDVIILKNHGVVCLGKNLRDAYIKTEVVEEVTKLNFITHLLQSPRH
ncbi:L-fuculose phosphate aldolase [Methanofervidicoccus abyssi]|uniref:L-fuculose phosphate aldolase n=1 Tax=Methanofervidicoccus abyssi TaxID=2082189 RepID=A0A401HNG3_9EURY|nr:L-fuculose phosphate aldolase [Methanofervidicoccus abyssi]GBF35796.1 L-fuculose-phosphate aldolase [Methanofervidicoccus abyssi]